MCSKLAYVLLSLEDAQSCANSCNRHQFCALYFYVFSKLISGVLCSLHELSCCDILPANAIICYRPTFKLYRSTWHFTDILFHVDLQKILIVYMLYFLYGYNVQHNQFLMWQNRPLMWRVCTIVHACSQTYYLNVIDFFAYWIFRAYSRLLNGLYRYMFYSCFSYGDHIRSSWGSVLFKVPGHG